MGKTIKGLFVLISLPFRVLFGVLNLGSKLIPSGGGGRHRDVRRIADTVRHELTRHPGLYYRTKEGAVSAVEWEQPLLRTPEEVWLPVRQPLPHGVTTMALEAEEVLQSLTDRLNADVRWDKLATGRCCYVVRTGTAQQFPEVFPINSFQLPPDAPPLAIPLGIDGYGEHQVADLATLPHLLGVGATGRGKSNFVHGMICSWISRNSPDDLELWLCDHKGGVELERYKPLLQTKSRPGIVRRFSFKPEDTVQLLEAAMKEMDRRLETFRQANCNELEDYGRQTGQYMRRLVIVIDEIFQLTLNREKIEGNTGGKKYSISDWAQNMLGQIASRGRAPGVHLCIFTQSSSSEVLSRLIKHNFEARIVFSVTDQYASIPVLGNANAAGLPKGRAIFRMPGDEQMMVQTPYLSQTQIRLLVSRISRYGPDGGLGAADEARRFRDDAKLLIQASCDYLDGTFARAKMLQLEGVRGVITKERFEQLAIRMEKDGVLEPGGPRKSRRVAKGYHGRAHLLDLIYGPQADQTTAGQGQTVEPAAASATGKHDTAQGHQDAIDRRSPQRPDTVYGPPADGTPAAADEKAPEPEPEIPPIFRKFMDDLDRPSAA